MKTIEETKNDVNKILDKIEDVKKIKEIRKKERRLARENELEKLTSDIRNIIIPRIIELKKIIQKMYDLKIPNNEFCTQQGKNNIGFYITSKENQSYRPDNIFGIAGILGKEQSLTINLYSNRISYDGFPLLSDSCMEKLRRIVNEFDEYEKNIIKYINDWCSKDN